MNTAESSAQSIPVTFRGGNLCNQLYYVLQAYISGRRYLPTANGLDMHKLTDNIVALCGDEHLAKSCSNLERVNSYCQIFGADFSIEQLNSFIENVMLPNCEHDIERTENRVAVHIRNGDYLNPE